MSNTSRAIFTMLMRANEPLFVTLARLPQSIAQQLACARAVQRH